MRMSQTQQQNVPALRFPEFSGEWDEKRVGEIAPLQRGFDLPTTMVEKGEYPVVYSNGILRYHNEFKAKGPGIVTGRSGTIGKVTFVTDAYWPHNTSLWVTDFLGNEPKYIYYFYVRLNLKRYNAGSTVPTLNRNDVHSVKRKIPTLPEQQKIASFLSSVDRKIEQLSKKKALLAQYKKGMMQKLFSQELRFKDAQGNDFPDWEEKRLGDVLKIGSGRDYKHLKAGKIPVYGTGGYMTSVDRYLHDGESVCIGRKGTIDKPMFLNGKFWTVDTLFFTHSFSSSVPKFVYAIFQTINWKKHNEASGVPSLSKTTIEKIKIDIPSVSEQQKIADFLSSVDRKIDLVATELNHAKTFKKGLLQQMFI